MLFLNKLLQVCPVAKQAHTKKELARPSFKSSARPPAAPFVSNGQLKLLSQVYYVTVPSGMLLVNLATHENLI